MLAFDCGHLPDLVRGGARRDLAGGKLARGGFPSSFPGPLLAPAGALREEVRRNSGLVELAGLLPSALLEPFFVATGRDTDPRAGVSPFQRYPGAGAETGRV